LTSLGHPSKFQWVSRFAVLSAATSLIGGQPNDVWPSPGLPRYIYIFGGSCPLTKFCPASLLLRASRRPLESSSSTRHVAIATQPVHRLQIRPPVHNWKASLTTIPSFIRVRSVVWACGCGQTDTHTDTQTQTRVTTIHFASSTTHAKCKNCTVTDHYW